MRDWKRGEVEPIPGKTMPGLKLVARDYTNLYNQFISFGPLVRENGLGAHGTHYAVPISTTKPLDAPTVPGMDSVSLARRR